MPEAWQVRGFQRQEFLRKLMREAYDAEEEAKDKAFLFILATHLLDHLLIRWRYLRLDEALKTYLPTHRGEGEETPEAEVFTQTKVMPSIEAFARSGKERDVLLATFLQEYLLPSVLTWFFTELQQQEHHHPRLIFGTDSPMDEVPLSTTD